MLPDVQSRSGIRDESAIEEDPDSLRRGHSFEGAMGS